ncbi:MAG: glycosyltransferase [Bacteroidota bacterium]
MIIQYPFTLQDIIFFIFSGALLLQLCYYSIIFIRLAFFKQTYTQTQQQPVSVVICAKNEEFKLRKNLQLILEQDYPNFEVVLVNDDSDDETALFIQDLKKEYANLKFVNLTSTTTFFKGKKFPLSIGILCAKNEWLLLTDADCAPASKNWLSQMQQNFTETTNMVLGFGAYEKQSGLLNKLIRFDSFYIALQYLSFAIVGMPYMGVGRNLAYRKSLFLKSKGFTSHYLIKSGDDDLFVNQNATRKTTRIEINPEAFTVSEAKSTFEKWVFQKRRHLSTGTYYKFAHKLVLSLLSISQWLLFLSFAALLYFNYNIYIIASAFLLRLIMQILVFKRVMDKINNSDLIFFSILFEIFFMIFNPIIYLSTLIRKPNSWK